MNIAFDMAGRLQLHDAPPNRSHNMAANNNFLGIDRSLNAGFFTDQDVRTVQITFNLTVNLNLTAGNQIALYRKIGTDK